MLTLVKVLNVLLTCKVLPQINTTVFVGDVAGKTVANVWDKVE